MCMEYISNPDPWMRAARDPEAALALKPAWGRIQGVVRELENEVRDEDASRICEQKRAEEREGGGGGSNWKGETTRWIEGWRTMGCRADSATFLLKFVS